MSDKVSQILDIAEEKVRAGGYNNFSFREIAKEVGIKSASIHYHFPSKADLGAAVARRYTDDFLNRLGAPTPDTSMRSVVKTYTDAYRQALINDRRLCLCGALGAETLALPETVRLETRRFFNKNIDWLVKSLHPHGSTKDVRELAIHIIATLEGAMIMALTLDDLDIFEMGVQHLQKDLSDT